MSEPVVQAFTVTGNDFSTGNGISPTIRAGADRQNTTPMVVVPVQDGRGMEKSQNGLGVGQPGDPMYTLDTTGAQAVAYTVHGEHSTAMTGNGTAAVAFCSEVTRCLDTTGGYTSNQGGTVVAQAVPVWWDGTQVADTLTTTSNQQMMPDKKRLQAVVQSINGDVAGTLDANYGKGPGERTGVERDVVVQEMTVPCQVDGSPVASTLRGFGHGWQGQHNTTNAVWVYDGYNQRLVDDGVAGSMRTRFDSSDFVAYAEPRLFEPMSLREENWAGREVKNALRAEASKSSHAVVDRPEPFALLNFQGSKSNTVVNGGDVSFTLNAMHGHDVHVVGYRQEPPAEETMDTNNNLVVRRLTPLECELLMGWEPGWTAEGVEEDGTVVKMADTHRYRMCGNGVVSNVGEWIGLRYVAASSDPQPEVQGVPRLEVEGPSA